MPFNVTAILKDNKHPINSSVHWKIIKGNEIIEKINNELVSVDTKGTKLGDQIVILAEINTENCRSIAVKRVLIIDNIDPTDIDRYGKISQEAEKARLDNLYINFQRFDEEVKDFPKPRIFTYLYYEKNTPYRSIKSRLQNILNHLSKTRGMKKDRIVFIIREAGKEETQYQILPNTFLEGMCNYGGCLVVKGEDFEKFANLFQSTATKKTKK